jgi:hypothetical protein
LSCFPEQPLVGRQVFQQMKNQLHGLRLSEGFRKGFRTPVLSRTVTQNAEQFLLKLQHFVGGDLSSFNSGLDRR